MEYKYDNMIMHPNLSVGATKKIYDINNNNQGTNYQLDQMNRQSPERKSTENPESQGDKKSSKKEEPVVHDPLPIELLIDERMIQLARAEGITDKSFLTGRMSPAVCNILAHAKLKHRTCK